MFHYTVPFREAISSDRGDAWTLMDLRSL